MQHLLRSLAILALLAVAAPSLVTAQDLCRTDADGVIDGVPCIPLDGRFYGSGPGKGIEGSSVVGQSLTVDQLHAGSEPAGRVPVTTGTDGGVEWGAQTAGGTADGVVNSVAMNVNANTLTVTLGRTVGSPVSGQTPLPLGNNLLTHRDGHGAPTADPTTAGQVQVNNDGDVFPAGDVVHHYTATPTIVSDPFTNSDWEFWNNVHESAGVPIHPAGVRTNALHFYWNSTGHNFYQNVSGTVRLTTWAQALARIASSGETIPAAIADRVFLGAFDDEDDAAYALSRRDDRSDNDWVLIYEGFAATDTLARVTSHTDGGVTRTDQPFWRNRLANIDDLANLGSASTLDWGTEAGDVPVLLSGGLLDRARLPVAGSIGQGAVVLALPEEVVAAGTGNDVLTAGHIPTLIDLTDLTLTDEETEVGTGVRSLDCSGEGIDCTFAGTTGTLVVHGERQIDLTYSLAATATDPEAQVADAIGAIFEADTDMTAHRYRFTLTVPAGAVNIRTFSGLYGKVTRVSATSYTADGDFQLARMRNVTDGDVDYVSELVVRQCNACVVEALIPDDGLQVSAGEYFALGVRNGSFPGSPRAPFIHVFDGAAAPEDSHVGDDAYPFMPFSWVAKWSRATDDEVNDGDQIYHNARYRDRIEVDYESGAPGLLRVDRNGTQEYVGPPHMNFVGNACSVTENATTGAADVTCTGGTGGTQSNWTETDSTSPAFILNKPTPAAATDLENIATDVLPANDDEGAVGSLARTWATGRFTDLTVDGRFTATGGNITVGGITVQGDLTAQNDIHLGDRDQIILGTNTDATFDFDDRTSHVEIRLNAGANAFVIYDGVGTDVVHEFDKDGSTSLIECHTQAEYTALTPGDHVLYVISDSCP